MWPLDFQGKNTGVVCHALLQGILPTQVSNPRLLCLLHWQVGSLSNRQTIHTLSDFPQIFLGICILTTPQRFYNHFNLSLETLVYDQWFTIFCLYQEVSWHYLKKQGANWYFGPVKSILWFFDMSLLGYCSFLPGFIVHQSGISLEQGHLPSTVFLRASLTSLFLKQ